MARPMKPLVRGGGYYPSRRWTPLVYPGGYTTANGGGQPEPEAVLKTVTGSLIHITDALALPAEALSVNVEPIQAGTGDPSPDNVRPISGWDEVKVWVQPTHDTSAAPTATIQLGETVYGGTLDVTAGKMVVDRAIVDMGTLTWAHNTTYAFFTSASLRTRKNGVTNIVSDLFKTEAGSWSGTPKANAIWGNGSNETIYVQYPIAEVSGFLSLVTGHQLCYELATPVTYTLTPTQIDMLLGTNNLWADAGDSTLTYYAEGEASTSEALGILLGGTYNNPGGADDVSDYEALGILLGGS